MAATGHIRFLKLGAEPSFNSHEFLSAEEGILSLEDVEDEATDYCESEQETLLSHDIDDDLATDYGDEDTESESELFSASLNCVSPVASSSHVNETVQLQSKSGPTNLLTCKLCPRVFKSKIGYEQHQFVHTEKKPFKCKTCSKQFLYEISLVKHEKRGCKKSNAPQHSIRQTKPKDITRVFQPVVPKETENPNLRNPLSPSNKRLFECSECSASFKFLCRLSAHFQRMHKKGHPYSCSFCGKGYFKRYERDDHVNQEVCLRAQTVGAFESVSGSGPTRNSLDSHLEKLPHFVEVSVASKST